MATLALLSGGLNAFGPLSMDMYLPAFPELAQDLHISSAAVQLTLAADVVGLELPMPDPPPPGADWIEDYRRWSAQQRGA